MTPFVGRSRTAQSPGSRRESLRVATQDQQVALLGLGLPLFRGIIGVFSSHNRESCITFGKKITPGNIRFEYMMPQWKDYNPGSYNLEDI